MYYTIVYTDTNTVLHHDQPELDLSGTALCALCVMILVFPDHCQHLRCTFRHLDQTLKIMFQKYLSETGNHRTIISMGKSRLINVSSEFILKGIHYQSTFSGTETIQKNRYIFVKFILR